MVRRLFHSPYLYLPYDLPHYYALHSSGPPLSLRSVVRGLLPAPPTYLPRRSPKGRAGSRRSRKRRRKPNLAALFSTVASAQAQERSRKSRRSLSERRQESGLPPGRQECCFCCCCRFRTSESGIPNAQCCCCCFTESALRNPESCCSLYINEDGRHHRQDSPPSSLSPSHVGRGVKTVRTGGWPEPCL